MDTFKPCQKHELRNTAGTETPQKPIESRKCYKQRHSFLDVCRRYQCCSADMYSAKFPPQPHVLTSGEVKRELFLYLVLSVLTFQSHQDGNLFPGCTLASVTIPAVSFIRSVLPAWLGHFVWQTRTCTVFCFFYFFGYYLGWYDRVGLPQIVQGGRRLSKEPMDNLLTSNSPWAQRLLVNACVLT